LYVGRGATSARLIQSFGSPFIAGLKNLNNGKNFNRICEC